MIDVVVRFTALVPGEDEVGRTEDKSWQAKGKVNANIGKGLKDDKGKDDSSHSSGSPEGIIARIRPVLQKSWNIGYDDAQQVKGNKIDPSGRSEQCLEYTLYGGSEKEK